MESTYIFSCHRAEVVRSLLARLLRFHWIGSFTFQPIPIRASKRRNKDYQYYSRTR